MRKAFAIDAYKGNPLLPWRPGPVARLGEVVVGGAAMSVNPLDVKLRVGALPAGVQLTWEHFPCGCPPICRLWGGSPSVRPRPIPASGPEFVSLAILKWLTENKVETVHLDPGKPWRNGTNESFNGRLRDECLEVEWFRTRREARIVIEAWRQHYNAVRPHMSLNYLTPIEYRQQHQTPTVSHDQAFFQQ